jgi:hypothetical protein
MLAKYIFYGARLALSSRPTPRRRTPIRTTALLPFAVRLDTEGTMEVTL